MWQRRQFKCDNEQLMNEVLDNFAMSKPKKTVWGNFRIKGNTLIYEYSEMKEKRIDQNSLKDLDIGARYSDYKKHPEKYSVKYDYDLETATKRVKEGMAITLQWSDYDHDTIAIKLPNGEILGNSAILPNVGATVAYGNKSTNHKETVIQKLMAFRKINMLPFNAFDQANVNVCHVKILERGAELTVKVKVERQRGYHEQRDSNKPTFDIVERHFTGASLVECENKCFLFDIDREEIKHNIFNPFIVELPRKVETIAQAYDSLMPKQVKDAIAKGLKVERQGEWFFIPAKVKAPKVSERELLLVGLNQRMRGETLLETYLGKAKLNALKRQGDKIEKRIAKATRLRVGNNRANNAELGFQKDNKTYVSGKVSHSGREHRNIHLKGWYEVIPNTAVKSFTVTGDID